LHAFVGFAQVMSFNHQRIRSAHFFLASFSTQAGWQLTGSKMPFRTLCAQI
jgi:hypothetical protein